MRHLSNFAKAERARILINYYSEHLESFPPESKFLVRSKIAEWRSIVDRLPTAA